VTDVRAESLDANTAVAETPRRSLCPRYLCARARDWAGTVYRSGKPTQSLTAQNLGPTPLEPSRQASRGAGRRRSTRRLGPDPLACGAQHEFKPPRLGPNASPIEHARAATVH
jgi:hypothetical protein